MWEVDGEWFDGCANILHGGACHDEDGGGTCVRNGLGWDGCTVNVTSRGMADAALCCVGDTFDGTTVTSSILLLLMGSKAYFVISFNL